MNYRNPSEISGYHAHVYFSAETIEQAKSLCTDASQLFGLKVGRFHERPVGPHPMFSCQLSCSCTQFLELLPWLALNRNGLIVFCHPQSGNDLADHTEHVIWLGESQTLDLSIF